MDDHSSGPAVTGRIKLPTRICWGKAALRVSPRAIPIRHCSRWGLPCGVCCQPPGGLLPHRFTLTPRMQGGLFSVALSLGLPPPGVTRHRYLMESGLSSRSCASLRRPRGHPALRAMSIWRGYDSPSMGRCPVALAHDSPRYFWQRRSVIVLNGKKGSQRFRQCRPGDDCARP